MCGRRGSVALMMGAALASLVGAQIDNGLPGPQPIDAGGMILRQQLLRGVMENNQRSVDRGGRQKEEAAGGYLVYRRDLAVTERVKRAYIAQAERAYGKKAVALRQFLDGNDFVQVWAKGAAADGMRPNDLGDSLAEYWATNWQIVRGLSSTMPSQTRAVRYQIGPVIARMPAIRRMSDAQKQTLSETLMLNLIFEVIGADAARKKGDPATLAKVRQATAVRFQQEFGVDLNTLNVTNRGLVRA